MFRGRTPTETFSPTYDAEGSIVGWSKVSEPQWTDLDQKYVLAWQQEQHSTHDCTRPIAECTAKENSFAYEAEVVVCHATAARERAVKHYCEQENADAAGVMARLVKGPNGPI